MGLCAMAGLPCRDNMHIMSNMQSQYLVRLSSCVAFCSVASVNVYAPQEEDPEKNQAPSDAIFHKSSPTHVTCCQQHVVKTCFHFVLPQEEDPEKYQVHFASYVANDLDGDSLEDMYKEVSVPAGSGVKMLPTQLCLEAGAVCPLRAGGFDWGKLLRAANAPARQPRSCGTL